MILHAYFDDSGTHDDSPATAWGGYVGTTEQWQKLEGEWQAKLKTPLDEKPPINKFRLYDCRHGLGSFKDYNPADRDLVRKEFRDIIIASGVKGVACAIDNNAHQRLVHGWANYHFGSPTAFTLCGVLEYTVQSARHNFPGFEHIAFHFDIGQESNQLHDMFRRGGRFIGEKYPKVTSVHFEKVSAVPALQAADTLAIELFWYAISKLSKGERKPPAPHLNHFLKSMEIDLRYVDEVELTRMLKETGHFCEDED